ncbi:MAG TPA: sigma-70 family RNA polymerase sigma factor [Polyangiaceae bacterium]
MIAECAIEIQASKATTIEDELALLSGLVSGHPGSWREFSVRYTRMLESCIARVAVRFPGLLGPEDVREIYALLCLNLLANDCHRLRSYDPDKGTRLGSWLGLIAAHTAYDYLRHVRREPTGPRVDELVDLAAQIPETSDTCERREQARQVAQLVEELSDRDREFMSLYFGQGLTAEQVADRMGISVKTVYTKKHKIRSKLESLMGVGRVAA